ncbi:hypothetical protein BC940DRAFT_67575 [Gongronella butleri]|nr:hypothetical protein BC940DRAFT_67575 [Gongronella butleri]
MIGIDAQQNTALPLVQRPHYPHPSWSIAPVSPPRALPELALRGGKRKNNSSGPSSVIKNVAIPW